MSLDISKLKELLALAECLGGVSPIPQSPTANEVAVLVTTEHRGVFFGYATEVSGETIKLKRARNILFWPKENKGFLGLAVMGSLDGARVGPAADIELRNITCVAQCTGAAILAWEKSPWK